ncbi:hypothetical protein GDO81_003517 [Engystomops pustulosus]|uniref:Uncharacterized protein n=1 Tax=Engystomops pustulosus TaxID=76066 RepID=A0AAV7A2H9_ENGPU|nr:hypothetical protein GDO81_003517 [Engystomops pustulosus]KAG8553701.1 hypothetical protein GDO81_003517 [Engystomops pustulosus]
MWLAALETPPPDEGCEPAETRVGLLSSRQRSGLIWVSCSYSVDYYTIAICLYLCCHSFMLPTLHCVYMFTATKSHQYQGCSSWHHITYNKKF